MVTLTICSYRGETDWQAIADLVKACEAVDSLDEEATAYELKLKLNAPSFDQSRDACLWESEQGKLIGLAVLDLPKPKEEIDGYLWFYVHPAARWEGLETEMITWGSKRLGEVSQEWGLPARLRTYSLENHINHQILLERQGFTSDRYFLTMARSLKELIPEVQLPTGFQLSHLKSQTEIQSWVEMFNESFVDHWNHHDLSVETVQHWMKDPNYQSELDLIAMAPNGKFAAFCDCQLNPENLKEGWIEFLGTRRGFRQMGLGKAMLLAGLHQLKKAGAEIAKLSVDADSLTGATHLYQSMGFCKVETWLAWSKAI
ncbi:MAG: GNAT family N-acetyltransferase [Actinomycetota bacterium]